MKLLKLILFQVSLSAREDLARTPSWRYCLIAAFVAAASISAAAKDPPTTAIVIFDGSQGATYLQLAGVTLNGKAEVRLCEGVSRLDKSNYNTLSHRSFIGASSLQREMDGMLTLTVDAKPVCAVPSNLKFDKKPELTPQQAAEQAVLQGTPVNPSALTSGIPELKPGVEVVFVAQPDSELAEFLRAQRVDSVNGWQDFLTKFPSSSRGVNARQALAGIHEKAADAAFAQYQQLSIAHKQDIAMLRQANMEAQAAKQALSGYAPALRLMDTIARELDRLLEADRVRLQTFQRAAQDHTAGYSQLVAAAEDVEQLLIVRPDYSPLLNLRREIKAEQDKVETVILSAESLTASTRYDDAVSALGSYACFARELPRADAILSAAYKYHFERGQRLADADRWEEATVEFRAATGIRPEARQAQASLHNATLQLSAQRDQEEAKHAVQKSNEYAQKNQFVEAYEVLANLPDTQRVLVTSQLSTLTRNYLIAARQRAQMLQEKHLPIKDRSDEDAVRQAYALLDRVSSLSGDPAIALKRDLLSSKISAYYVDQASRYLQKPLGSGAGIGCLYLEEAQRYAITNADDVRDQMTRYAPSCRRRTRLSMGLVIRDQTSRRDNPGFSEQLMDAIANALESSGMGVEIVRNPLDFSQDLQPNFTLIGEVLEHRVTKSENVDAPQSKYRAGTHETKNPAWLQTTRDYDSAQQQLAAARQSLVDAQSQHKKKDVIAAATDAIQREEKHVDELRQKLEITDQSQVEIIIEPYHYTKKNIDLNGSIELVFHITDRFGNTFGQPIDTHQNAHKTAVVIQDVKPEDTEGITNQGVEPDEDQFLTDLETQSRNLIVDSVQNKTAELVSTILQDARNRAKQGDFDGAAEQYIVYLNSAPDNAPDRAEAAKFLGDRFDVAVSVRSRL